MAIYLSAQPSLLVSSAGSYRSQLKVVATVIVACPLIQLGRVGLDLMLDFQAAGSAGGDSPRVMAGLHSSIVRNFLAGKHGPEPVKNHDDAKTTLQVRFRFSCTRNLTCQPKAV